MIDPASQDASKTNNQATTLAPPHQSEGSAALTPQGDSVTNPLYNSELDLYLQGSDDHASAEFNTGVHSASRATPSLPTSHEVTHSNQPVPKKIERDKGKSHPNLPPGSYKESRPFVFRSKEDVSLTQVTENKNPYVAVTCNPEKDHLPPGTYYSVLKKSPRWLRKAIGRVEGKRDEAYDTKRRTAAEGQLSDAETRRQNRRKREIAGSAARFQERQVYLFRAMCRLCRAIEAQAGLIESLMPETVYWGAYVVDPESSLGSTYNLERGLLGGDRSIKQLNRDKKLVASEYMAFKIKEAEPKNERLSLVSIDLESAYRDLSKKSCSAEQEKRLVTLFRNFFQASVSGDEKQLREAYEELQSMIRGLPALDDLSFQSLGDGAVQRRYHHYQECLRRKVCLQERERILADRALSSTISANNDHYLLCDAYPDMIPDQLTTEGQASLTPQGDSVTNPLYNSELDLYLQGSDDHASAEFNTGVHSASRATPSLPTSHEVTHSNQPVPKKIERDKGKSHLIVNGTEDKNPLSFEWRNLGDLFYRYVSYVKARQKLPLLYKSLPNTSLLGKTLKDLYVHKTALETLEQPEQKTSCKSKKPLSRAGRARKKSLEQEKVDFHKKQWVLNSLLAAYEPLKNFNVKYFSANLAASLPPSEKKATYGIDFFGPVNKKQESVIRKRAAMTYAERTATIVAGYAQCSFEAFNMVLSVNEKLAKKSSTDPERVSKVTDESMYQLLASGNEKTVREGRKIIEQFVNTLPDKSANQNSEETDDVFQERYELSQALSEKHKIGEIEYHLLNIAAQERRLEVELENYRQNQKKMNLSVSCSYQGHSSFQQPQSPCYSEFGDDSTSQNSEDHETYEVLFEQPPASKRKCYDDRNDSDRDQATHKKAKLAPSTSAGEADVSVLEQCPMDSSRTNFFEVRSAKTQRVEEATGNSATNLTELYAKDNSPFYEKDFISRKATF